MRKQTDPRSMLSALEMRHGISQAARVGQEEDNHRAWQGNIFMNQK